MIIYFLNSVFLIIRGILFFPFGLLGFIFNYIHRILVKIKQKDFSFDWLDNDDD